MVGKWVDIDRVKSDFDDFLHEFGCPIYHRAFGSASTHPYYGTQTYGTSTITSFPGVWRYVTADDYRIIAAGRCNVGDAVAIIPSNAGITISQKDEYYLKGQTDYFNASWKQDNIIGSQVAFYECGLTVARGRR